jgi:hypothetical protein
MASPDSTSQRRTVWSSLPVARTDPSELKAATWTGNSCRRGLPIRRFAAVSQILAEQSKLAVAK